jgi:hypothetical protein
VLKGNFEDLAPLLIKIGAAPNSKLLFKLLKNLNKSKAFLKNPLDMAENMLNSAKDKAGQLYN